MASTDPFKIDLPLFAGIDTLGLTIISALTITVLILLDRRHPPACNSRASNVLSSADKAFRQQQEENIRTLEAANAKLAKQLGDLCRPGGLVLTAHDHLRALRECQAQLRATERVLQETQSKLIVLEYGNSPVKRNSVA